MSCENCVQKILAANEADKKILEQAAEQATKTGNTYAIYRDASGQLCYTNAAESTGLPVFRYISPQYRDVAL